MYHDTIPHQISRARLKDRVDILQLVPDRFSHEKIDEDCREALRDTKATMSVSIKTINHIDLSPREVSPGKGKYPKLTRVATP